MKKGADNGFGLVGKYKFKSIFVKILIFLLLYSSVFLAVIFLYNNYIIKNNVEKRLELRTLGVLEKTQESIDRELRNLSNQIRQLSKEEYIRAAMTAPNLKNTERNYNIVQQLSSVVSVSELVDEAVLYITTDDTFFSSEGTSELAVSPELLEDRGRLIERLKESDASAGKLEFTAVDGEYYLFLNAPVFYDRVLGILAFRIDAEALLSIVDGRVEGEETFIWVFDEENHPMFSRYRAYPRELTPEYVRSISAVSDNLNAADENYYKIVSEDNGWQYLLRTDADLFTVENAAVDKGFLAIIAALVFFCLIFSVYLARSVYLPVSRLIGIADRGDGNTEGKPVKNEFELLEKNVSDTVMQNQELSHFLSNIRPAMVSDTFRNLLLGHEIPRDKLDEMFRMLGTGFDTRLNYSLMLAALIFEEKDFSLVECNILLHRLEQEINVYSENKFLSCCVYMLENRHMAVVLGASRDISAKQIREWKAQLEERMREICEVYPVRFLLGTSRYAIDIMELYQNFAAICQDMNYRAYLDLEDERQNRASVELDCQAIRNSFETMKKKVDNGEDEAAREQMADTVRELLDGKRSEADIMAFAALWWKIIVNELIMLDVFVKEELEHLKKQLFMATGSPEEFLKGFGEVDSEIVSRLSANSRKLKRKYVERAKQYIEEHYSESDLSLSGISEFLGISQSYMSTQFKKETGINFLDYLNRYRIERSRLLLQMTEMTVEEIGFRTGFSSAKNFIRVFKKYTDTSPGMFREQSASKEI